MTVFLAMGGVKVSVTCMPNGGRLKRYWYSHSELLLRHLAKRSTSLDTSDLEVVFQRIEEQTIKLTTLIDKLLDVNTFRSHTMVLSKSRCDLNQLCRKVIEDQHLLTGREMVFSPSVEPLELQMDVDRMTQVILNLVSNALKYSSQDKPVEVRVSQNDQRALLWVQDHGFGVAPDELPHIFEMYYRTSRAHSSTTSGLGLGLAISQAITDRHGDVSGVHLSWALALPFLLNFLVMNSG